jgi:hypothetical protein
MSDPHYEHRACSICGARTDDEAGNLCKSYQLPSGDYTCDGGAEEEAYPDGRLRFLSAEGIEAINAWVDEQVAKDHALQLDREQQEYERQSGEPTP